VGEQAAAAEAGRLLGTIGRAGARPTAVGLGVGLAASCALLRTARARRQQRRWGEGGADGAAEGSAATLRPLREQGGALSAR
jgi:hypothetical protein